MTQEGMEERNSPKVELARLKERVAKLEGALGEAQAQIIGSGSLTDKRIGWKRAAEAPGHAVTRVAQLIEGRA